MKVNKMILTKKNKLMKFIKIKSKMKKKKSGSYNNNKE